MLFCSNLMNESLFLKLNEDKVGINVICYVINLFCQVKSIRNPSTAAPTPRTPPGLSST